MRIGGLQKLSMVDFPGKLAATVFTAGCNLRCPFCHNAPLVTHLEEAESLTIDDVLAFLSTRKRLLDGVVLSGGEPLLQPGAADFLRAVKEMGFAVKLDTNGCYPEVLAQILDADIVDYVAMDIKNCLPKYPQTVGMPGFDTTPIEESADMLRSSGVAFEFRTTLIREFHTLADLEAVGRWLEGSPRYYLQNFVDSGNLVGAGVHGFSPQEMEAFLQAVKPFFRETALRGL